MEFLEPFPYVIKYKQGKKNVVADVSRRYMLLSTLTTKLLGFEHLKELYVKDVDFGDIFALCEKSGIEDFYRHDGFPFKKPRLCVPQSSVRELLVREVNSGGLMGHFGVVKTLEITHIFTAID